MEDTNQGEGNETPQTPAPTPVEPGTDNHSVEPTPEPPVENQAPEVKPEQAPEPTQEEEPEVKKEEAEFPTITVDKRAIEFLERNLGYEAMKHFKENFLK